MEIFCLCLSFTAQSTNGVISSAVSLPNHTFTGQAYSSKRLTSFVYILPPGTFNQRKGENDHRKYFMISLHERMLSTRQGLSPQPPDYRSDEHLTELPRPASIEIYTCSLLHFYIF